MAIGVDLYYYYRHTAKRDQRDGSPSDVECSKLEMTDRTVRRRRTSFDLAWPDGRTRCQQTKLTTDAMLNW